MSYNLKFQRFPDGTVRVTVYEYEVVTGEPSRKKEMEKCANPFDGRMALVVKDFVCNERSFNESMRRTKSAVYDYSLSNAWDWFVTLTFAPDKVDRYYYESCVKAMKQFLKYVRRHCPDVRYLIVPELHKDGAFHFHGLLGSCAALPVTFSGIVRNGRRVYNIDGYKAGFSTATRVTDSRKSGNYICKYITKELCAVSANRKRYWASRNLEKPEIHSMLADFGPDKRDLFLDSLFPSASYYKHTGGEDFQSHFFEFPPGAVAWEDFRRFASYSGY